MVDLELGLYHACCPQSYSQNICLCGHVNWRSDAGHVLKETTKCERGEGGKAGERKRGVKKVKCRGEKWWEREKRENLMTCRKTWHQKRINIRYHLQVCRLKHCVCCARVAEGAVCAVIRLKPQEAQHLIMMNIHILVYHNNTLRLGFQTQISY